MAENKNNINTIKEPKITILPPAGREEMGNGWDVEAKPAGARRKTSHGWESYHNPAGASGLHIMKNKRKEEEY